MGRIGSHLVLTFKVSGTLNALCWVSLGLGLFIPQELNWP